ncbi:hypothetical protein [Saccharothrix sp. Mg75]|uniref:hypothetical protein n=1 Tax=Saccharothrix sp. Mg75 TaxID=3445357 RepID=UPI003EE9356C
MVRSRTLPEAEDVACAQRLPPTPRPIPAPLGFARVPAGTRVVTSIPGPGDEFVTFAAPETGGPARRVGVSRVATGVGELGTPVPVGDRTGRLVGTPGHEDPAGAAARARQPQRHGARRRRPQPGGADRVRPGVTDP